MSIYDHPCDCFCTFVFFGFLKKKICDIDAVTWKFPTSGINNSLILKPVSLWLISLLGTFSSLRVSTFAYSLSSMKSVKWDDNWYIVMDPCLVLVVPVVSRDTHSQ